MTASLRGVWLGFLLAAVAGAGAVALHRGAVRPAVPASPPASVATASSGPSAPAANPTAFRGLGELAYVADGQLTIIDAPRDGTGVSVHRVVQPGCAENPAWSPDGRWLAFVRYECPKPGLRVPSGDELAVVGADGTGLRVLDDWPGAVAPGAFAWSPVGDRLAVAPLSGGIWTVDLADATHPSSSARPVVEAGVQASSPVWSPDGRQIAFIRTLPFKSPETRSDALDTVAAGGGPPNQRLVANSAGIIPFGWWTDGRGLLYWLDPVHSVSIAADGLPLYSLPLGGGAPRRLMITPVNPAWLAWSPGGERLLAVAGHTRWIWTDKLLARCDPKTGTCARLPNPPHSVALDPAWSPDGQSIAFVAAQDLGKAGIHNATEAAKWAQTRTLWVERADGSGAHPIPDAGGGVYDPAWSRDGQQLLFVRNGALWLIGARGGQPAEIASPAGLRQHAVGGPAAVFAWHR